MGHSTKRKKVNLIGDVLRREPPSRTLCLIKIYNRREDEEEDVSSYWMMLKKREDIGN